MERELHINEILSLLNDSAYHNPEYTKAILNAETGIEFKKTLTTLLIDEGDYSQAQSLLNNLEQSENISQDWLSYHQILLSLFEQEKTIYQMDSTQLAYIIDLAYKCPIDNTVANAQSILYLLYGIEVEDCVELTTRSKRNLVKDITFVLPEDDAWIEDNFPNPFTNETFINYYLPVNSTGSIIINDMFGRLVISYNLNNGENTFIFKKPENLMPGVYTYGYIVDGKAIEYNKMIITQ